MWRRSFRFVTAALMLGASLSSMLQIAKAGNGAEGLNRLFTDPESRARMDAARKGDPVQENMGEGQAAKKVRVDGVVIREDNNNVVWINGTSSMDSDKAGGVQVRTRQIDRKDYRVPVKLEDQTVRLKPGQAWTGENGRVSDDY